MARLTAGTEAVRRYYDRNTARFERVGEGGATLHRAVWLPGVATRAEAFRAADGLVATAVGAGSTPLRLLDLGCGLGESIRHLTTMPGVTAVGVTLSPRQAAAASARGRQVVAADMQALPESLGTFDAAYGIESFVHCPDQAAVYASVAARLRPGGLLVVVDDVLGRPPASRREARWVEEVRGQWLGIGLGTVADAVRAAAGAGMRLAVDRDLSPYLELRRPRDRAVAGLALAARLAGLTNPYAASLRGGDALQRALLAGVIEYRALTFRSG